MGQLKQQGTGSVPLCIYFLLIISFIRRSGREEMSAARSSGSCTGGAACVRQGQQTRLLQNLFKDRWKPLRPLPGEVPAAEQRPSRQPPGIPGLPPAWRALSHAWRFRTRARLMTRLGRSDYGRHYHRFVAAGLRPMIRFITPCIRLDEMYRRSPQRSKSQNARGWGAPAAPHRHRPAGGGAGPPRSGPVVRRGAALWELLAAKLHAAFAPDRAVVRACGLESRTEA